MCHRLMLDRKVVLLSTDLVFGPLTVVHYCGIPINCEVRIPESLTGRVVSIAIKEVLTAIEISNT